MGKGAFHQGLRGGMAVLFQELFVQAASVDADSNGDFFAFAYVRHGLDPVCSSDVSGIDANFRGAAFCGGDGQTVIKMNVRHQRQGRLRRDLREALSRGGMGHRQPGNLAAGCL